MFAPAGWYPNNNDPNSKLLRYWDGSTWTQYTHDTSQDAPSESVAPDENRTPGVVQKPEGSAPLIDDESVIHEPDLDSGLFDGKTLAQQLADENEELKSVIAKHDIEDRHNLERSSIGAGMHNLDLVERFLIQESWRYTRYEENYGIKIGVSADNGNWSILIIAEDDLVTISSMLEQYAPSNKYMDVVELLTRANFDSVFGKFLFNFSNGQISYMRMLEVEDGELRIPMIEKLLYGNIFTMDRYLPAIMAVGYAGVDPEEALANIED